MASASSEGSITDCVSNTVSDSLAENSQILIEELPIDSSMPTMITEPPEAASVQMETDSIPDKSAEEAVEEENTTKVIGEITPMETEDEKTQEEDKIEQDDENIPVNEKTTPVLTPEILAPLSTQKSVLEQSVENKRKRSTSSDKQMEKITEENEDEPNQKRVKQTSDSYCWRCHRNSVESFCSTCSRSWHRKCIGGAPITSTEINWICGECACILKAENPSSQSPVMANLTIEQLCMILRYIVERLRISPGSEPFWKAVDLEEVPTYLDYIIKPMDLSLLEANIRKKMYGSTEAFMADAKWILHNCIVFNTDGGTYPDSSKLTNSARQILKIARQEVSEVEACADCYIRSRNLPRPQLDWFIEACHPPHPLVWAKLKGFPYWPAKAMPRINNQGFIDVRFFGEHDRAWVSPKDLYLYSIDPPTTLPRKRRSEMASCFKEVEGHCQKLEESFGVFTLAPAKVPYNPHDPTQIKILLPKYEPPISTNDSVMMTNSQHVVTLGNDNSVSPNNSNSILKNSPQHSGLTVESINNVSNNLVPESDNLDSEKSEDSLAPTLDIAEGVKQKKRGQKISSSIESLDTQITTGTSIKKSQVPRKLPKKVAAVRKSVKDNLLEKTVVKKRQTPAKRINVSASPNGRLTKAALKQNNYQLKSGLNESGELNSSDWKPSLEGNHGTDDEQNGFNDNYSSSLERPSTSAENSESLSSPIKQSKAKKSFPNKPQQTNSPVKQESSLSENKPMVYIPSEKITDLASYDLPPPEAGPLSAKLNKGANELVKKMAQIMEETVRDAVDNMGNSNDNNNQATIYSLRLEIERMRWLHEQQIAELKYNAEKTLREMRLSFDAERIRVVEDNKRQHEEEITKLIEDTKKKQWCSFCGLEAVYYCCWNTSYCTVDCQRAHWKTHMTLCGRKNLKVGEENVVVPGDVKENEEYQEMPGLVANAPANKEEA